MRDKDINGHLPVSTPVSGLNDNLEFLGRQLHIQTENTGSPATRIVTQVFCKGRVILSRKTDPPSVPGGSGAAADIRELMNSQHHQIIKELKDKLAQLTTRPSHQDS